MYFGIHFQFQFQLLDMLAIFHNKKWGKKFKVKKLGKGSWVFQYNTPFFIFLTSAFICTASIYPLRYQQKVFFPLKVCSSIVFPSYKSEMHDDDEYFPKIQENVEKVKISLSEKKNTVNILVIIFLDLSLQRV